MAQRVSFTAIAMIINGNPKPSWRIYFLLHWEWTASYIYVYDNARAPALGSCAHLGGRKVITARHFIAAKMLRRVLHRRRRFVSNCRSEWAAAVILLTGASSRLAPRRDVYKILFARGDWSLCVTAICVYNIITLYRIERAGYNIYLGGPNCTTMAPPALYSCVMAEEETMELWRTP